ncbi:lysophospholipase [Aquabacterium sp. A7-Y]|uniref:alpha/beta hydrolase n=1 Tax=Aquabacterium sp. A7-Y TaxID=1349605 RepID=UPI00223D9A85|nr:alpha/beta fold hydrolase [Aquabacterium sp. A7-Y]MCW7537621.1 lysophospholipase [Aquabacterium sp. A7-Y]
MNFAVVLHRRLLPALLSLLVLTAGCSALDSQQRRWIFQPQAAAARAGTAPAAGTQDVWLDFTSRESGEPVRLHALWFPADKANAPALLYLHGARWGVSGRASGDRIRRMREMGFSVLAVDYRGFGLSTPSLPSEAGAHEDALAAWQWLARHQPQAPRYIFGHSLGGAIAVHLASEVEDLQGLMVEGTFTSVADVFATMRWGWLPISWLITQRFDSAERMGRVKAPVLVVHGSADSLIRPELGRALYERVPGRKRFELVEGGSHFSTHALGEAQYRAALQEFFGLAPAQALAGF